MQDSMIERVARAMEPGAFATYDRGFTAMNSIEQRAFLNAEKVAKRARKKARDAIEAMREPTEAMIEAGVSADTGRTMGSRVTLCWQTMLDAAIPASLPVGENK